MSFLIYFAYKCDASCYLNADIAGSLAYWYQDGVVTIHHFFIYGKYVRIKREKHPGSPCGF